MLTSNLSFFQSVQKKIFVNLIFGQFGQTLHQNMHKNLKFLIKKDKKYKKLGILWVKNNKNIFFFNPPPKKID